MGIGQHEKPHRGATDEWITPKVIIDRLGPFDLDPCANEPRPWACARVNWTFEDLGLMQKWFGRVWLNPPYGPETKKWLEHLAGHGRGTALIFLRTDTKWFMSHCWQGASGMLFVYGRIVFHRPNGEPAPGCAGAPSVLVAYGAEDADRLRTSGIPGVYVDSWTTSPGKPAWRWQASAEVGDE